MVGSFALGWVLLMDFVYHYYRSPIYRIGSFVLKMTPPRILNHHKTMESCTVICNNAITINWTEMNSLPQICSIPGKRMVGCKMYMVLNAKSPYSPCFDVASLLSVCRDFSSTYHGSLRKVRHVNAYSSYASSYRYKDTFFQYE